MLEKQLFSKEEVINGSYEVLFPIHKTTLGESYRVKRIVDGSLYMLKIYFIEKMKPTHFDSQNFLIEAKIHSQTNHPNICKFIEHGEIFAKNQRLIYYVVKFISGETLNERMNREGINSFITCLEIIEQIGDAVNYLHSQHPAIIHGDITPMNIMLDYTANNNPILFDFGFSNYEQTKGNEKNLTYPSILYCAPERLRDENSTIASDIFSLGVLLYFLFTGKYPWSISKSINETEDDEIINKLEIAREQEIKFSPGINIDIAIKRVIIKCLSLDPNNRFTTVDALIDALKGKENVSQVDLNREKQKHFKKQSESGGLNKIAGMKSLKENIMVEVIEPLLNPENAASYGIKPPNGVLFYGPPGCGKTFFAECLAEEVGFNFMKVSPSDIGSVYIHGSQEKIRKLFDEAREKAPTILFLDEIDAMIPNRGDHDVSHSMSSEVNEWLVQMNNSAKNNVFIIGATNLIEKMDKAILRSGRFDRKVFIPLPDQELREELFKLELEKRKTVIEEEINFQKLSEITAGFLSSDINLICMDAARNAYRNKCKITEEILITTIESSNPSISEDDLIKYQADFMK